jgi:hypothetical protein
MDMSLHVKYLLFLSDFNQTWILSTYFQKIFKVLNFMKICPVRAELVHVEGQTDGQTDMMKLIVTFCNFVNTPKIHTNYTVCVFATYRSL